MSIGKNIAKYRMAKGLTQEELGAKIGVSNQAVSKWETGVTMPDIMLLPKLISVLNISFDDLYGITKVSKKPSISADDFPSFCNEKLIEEFYNNARIRFTHIGKSDKEQIEYLNNKFLNGCRIGCLSNIKGAIIMSKDFSFIDTTYKFVENENAIVNQIDSKILSILTDENFQKIFYFQYKNSFEKSKVNNNEFTFKDIMNGCNLTELETKKGLELLKQIRVNDIYKDTVSHEIKIVFLISNALYVHAIYKLLELLINDACWILVRDTSLIDDYAFLK